MPYTLQSSSSGYFVVNDTGERKNKQPMSRSRALRFLKALYANVSDATTKAANYSATAGQTIAGALGRGGDGKFVRVGSSDGDKARKLIQDINRKQQQKLAKKKPAKSKRAAAAKKPAAKKQAAPKKTDAQKEQERQARLAQRQAEREQRRKDAEAKKQQERRDNDKKVAQQTGLGTDTHDALTEFASPDEKIQLSPKNAAELEKRGLVEKDASGDYRMTRQGRQYVAAAQDGDVRRAADAISEGSDTVAKNQQRATEKQARTDAQAKRRADVEARRAEREAKQKEKQSKGGGGKAKLSEADKQAQKEQQRASNRQSFAPQVGVDANDAEELARTASSPGVRNDRLVSAGLQNEQGEATDQGRRFLSAVERGDLRGAQAALQDARQRREREATRNERQRRISQRRQARSIRRVKASLDEPAILSVFKASNGTWRWLIRSGSAFLDRDREIFSRKALIEAVERNRERGYYGPLRWWHCGEIDTVARKAGPGLDIGDCDFSGVIGRTLVESGTFRAERYARAAAEHAASLKASLGVVYKPLDISADRVYDRLDIVERSLCPADKARNQLSGSLHVFQR